jgi:hypothetical protein
MSIGRCTCLGYGGPDQSGSTKARNYRVHLARVGGIPSPRAAEPRHDYRHRFGLPALSDAGCHGAAEARRRARPQNVDSAIVSIIGGSAWSVSRLSGSRTARPTTASNSAPRATSKVASMVLSIVYAPGGVDQRRWGTRRRNALKCFTRQSAPSPRAGASAIRAQRGEEVTSNWFMEGLSTSVIIESKSLRRRRHTGGRR